VKELRDTLCSDASKGFSDDQIRQDAANVVDAFKKLNVVGESPTAPHAERPTKRRRTKQKPIPDEAQQTVYEQLKMRINGSTEDSPNPELVGLHDSIQ
jgi:serine/threonine-protein kinase ATR